jgi:N-acetylmuramoyl-L-alanine amidase
LKRSVGTTVIVECGFLTNPQEEAKLQEEAYQDALVQAVCDGILDYLHQSVLDAA